MNSIKAIIFALVLFVIVMLSVEYVYGIDKCCSCCKKKQTTCEGEICEVEVCSDGCCRCSFLKENFGIDIYFWKNKDVED